MLQENKQLTYSTAYFYLLPKDGDQCSKEATDTWPLEFDKVIKYLCLQLIQQVLDDQKVSTS